MTGLLSDKLALVTGAASGIVREVAVAFAREGAEIVGLGAAARASPVQTYAISTLSNL